MIDDLGKFLDRAEEYDILVTVVLWNGAVYPSERLIDLMWDDSKLDTYISNALKPMVKALSGKVRMAHMLN